MAQSSSLPTQSIDHCDKMDALPIVSKSKDQNWSRQFFLKLRKSSSTTVSDQRLLSSGFVPISQTTRPLSVLVPPTNDENTVLESLDQRYFTDTFDPVAYMLEQLPETPNEFNAFMDTEISAVGVTKDVVFTKLQAEVRSNSHILIQGMNVVQEVDLDFVRAQIHVKNGRRLLATAKNDLILSSLKIVKTKRNRDRVSEIITFGSQIVQIFKEEDQMNMALQKRRFITAVDICISLRKKLSHDELHGFTVLEDIRLRVNNFIPKLRKLFDQSLRKVAEHFDPLEYKELLQAYITLADHCEHLGFEFSSYTLAEVLSNIPEIIVRSIDDSKRDYMCQLFKAALPRKMKNEKKTTHIEENSAAKNGERADVVLTPASETVESIKRCYEYLTNVMHTYYLLVQWHRDPFNLRNDDIVYLHRCGIDDDDDDDDDVSDDDNDHYENACHDIHSPKHCHGSGKLKEPKSPLHCVRSSKQGHSSSQRSLYDQVLCDTGMTLLRYRKIVWENIQQTVLEMLEKLDTSYGYQMEHIIALSRATTTFSDIGEEFTGVLSPTIRSVLQVKCEQYLHAFHDDNIELARMLLDTENWARISTPSTDGGAKLGLLRLTEKRSGYFFERKARNDLAVNPIYLRRVFPSFHIEGNPFDAAKSMEWLSMKQGIRFHHERNGGGHSGDKSLLPECDNHPLHVMDPKEPEFVLTSSSLSGFVRLCGAYLKMMEHLPHISWNVFRLLNGLFEFNLYVVFTNFIPVDDIIECLNGKCGNLMNEAARWNELRTAICRIANEINVGEVLLQSSALIYPSTTCNGSIDQQQNSPMLRQVTLRMATGTPVAVKNANESNLYALAERSIACETVVTQSRLLDAIKDFARSYLPDQYLCLVDEVYERNHVVAQELRSFMYSTIATRLVDVAALLESVRAVSWDITYISDQYNEYVVHLVQKCEEVWERLQILAHRSMPVDAREEIWAAMVQAVMDTLLQAFSTVPNPTPQGRAVMLLDLHTLQNGLDRINHISSRSVPRGREYVGSYIKAFYYDEHELLEWVQDNKALYSKIQFANLIKNGIGLTLDSTKLRELVLKIDALIS